MDLKNLSKSQLIKLLLKQDRKKTPKVVIVDDTKPIKPIKKPSAKPARKEGWVRSPKTNHFVKIGSKTYYKLFPEKRPVREGWMRGLSGRQIKIDGPTYQREFPMEYTFNKINKVKKPLEEEIIETEDRYQKMVSGDETVIPPTIEIKQVDQALKGYTKSFKINIIDKKTTSSTAKHEKSN